MSTFRCTPFRRCVPNRPLGEVIEWIGGKPGFTVVVVAVVGTCIIELDFVIDTPNTVSKKKDVLDSWHRGGAYIPVASRPCIINIREKRKGRICAFLHLVDPGFIP
jgi:hypothetical protein